MNRRPRPAKPDRAEFERALQRQDRERSARAGLARRRLKRLMAGKRPGGGGARADKMRLISIHLEERQIEAAKLVAEVRGGPYQEWIRTWIEAGLMAEASAKRK